MVKNLPANSGDTGLIPGLGTKIPHATGQQNIEEHFHKPFFEQRSHFSKAWLGLQTHLHAAKYKETLAEGAF